MGGSGSPRLDTNIGPVGGPVYWCWTGMKAGIPWLDRYIGDEYMVLLSPFDMTC